MNKKMPQNYLSRLLRAIIEFDLIADGDKILIGLSGGKDSLFLTYALSILRGFSAKRFELAAFTLDLMFNTDFDTTGLAKFCRELEIPFYTDKADIAGVIAQTEDKEPCFTCAFFRRGAINRVALEKGFNKIAYAHHHDDAVETFLMGQLYSGQLRTFLPKTYLSRTGLTVIRPLIYFREKELRATVKLHGFTPLPSPCPYNGKTKRQEVKELIHTLEKNNRHIYGHLAAAMRSSATELWPPPISREKMKEQHLNFWKTENNKNTSS